ncbi:hypothetical protein D0B54_22555 [Solimonas sp. K1W22B-7]|uniref:hypothetical protein n=1 Tax=Solimonas sp. K1W22B-7 TaxID=2303331 RepID=UPI000E32DDB8|nr:hypothetical protein [Solimonas sp. K1W22B-7]AXQ31292.1 hypothetical protein D0B54_22555 [Solimonas sp. K1W22B-7]
MRRLLAMSLLGFALAAAAHDGHEQGDPPASAAAALDPRVELHSSRTELVVVRTADALLVYADDYVTNAPLEGLQVAVTTAGRRVEAEALGDGVYRLPLDLLQGATPLQLQLHGAAGAESFPLTLPPAPPPPAAVAPAWIAWAAAASAALVLLGLWFARRRRGRA